MQDFGKLGLIRPDLSGCPQYRKTALTFARALTSQDVTERNGIIQTLEGPKPFHVGMILCSSGTEEWPLEPKDFFPFKALVENLPNGWASYKNTNTVRAMKVDFPFSIECIDGSTLRSKSGDYLVSNNEKIWIVDSVVFIRDYEKL